MKRNSVVNSRHNSPDRLVKYPGNSTMAAVDAVDFDSVEPRVGVESVRSTAESVGIVSLDDNLAHTLADDTTFKVKYIIQVT